MTDSKWTDLRGLLSYLPGQWSRRYIYYLIQTKQIPHYKPSPQKLIFNKQDIDVWLASKRVDAEGQGTP